jgi:hypothetical protein
MNKVLSSEAAKSLLRTFPRVYLRSDPGEGISSHYHKARLLGVQGEKFVIQPFGHGKAETVEFHTVRLWEAAMRLLATEINVDLDACLNSGRVDSDKNPALLLKQTDDAIKYILICGRTNQVYTPRGVWSNNPNQAALFTLSQVVHLWESLSANDEDLVYFPKEQAFMYLGENTPVYSSATPPSITSTQNVEITVNVGTVSGSEGELVAALKPVLRQLLEIVEKYDKRMSSGSEKISDTLHSTLKTLPKETPAQKKKTLLVRRKSNRLSTLTDQALGCLCDAELTSSQILQKLKPVLPGLSPAHVSVMLSKAHKEKLIKQVGKEGRAHVYALNRDSANFTSTYRLISSPA